MKRKISVFRRYKLTFIGMAVALLLLGIVVIFEIDIGDMLIDALVSTEKYELDELFLSALVFLGFLMIDLFQQQKKQKIEKEKEQERITIYTAMLSSAHHILNNFLNQMQIVKITADDTPGFDKKVLDLYDTIMQDAKKQIQELSNLTEITEETIKESVTPK